MRSGGPALCALLALCALCSGVSADRTLPDADPQALVEAAEEQAAKEENVVRVQDCYYVVTKGDTIDAIAGRFGVPISLIQTYNDWVGVVRKFEVGMELHIAAVKDGRQKLCVSKERADRAEKELESADEKEEAAGEKVVGKELSEAQRLRKEVEAQLVRYNAAARAQASEHCEECAEARKEERAQLLRTKKEEERSKLGDKLEQQAEAEFKAREHNQVVQGATQPKCEYTVRGEDTYGSISELFGIVPRLLREANGMSEGAGHWFEHPPLGQRLSIKAARASARANCDMQAKVCPYKVHHGDSLGSIADKFGASRLHIALINQLPSSDFTYYPKGGLELRVPNPSAEGAQHCAEVPTTETVAALRVDRKHKSTELPVVVPPQRTSEAARVAGERERAAAKAEAGSKAAMEEAEEKRHAAEAAKEAAKEAATEYARTRTEYAKAREAGDEAAMKEAAAREHAVSKEVASKRAEAAERAEEAKEATAEAQERSAEWQTKTAEAEQAAAVAEAHEDLEEAAEGQNLEQEGATGGEDVDFSGPVKEGPADDVEAARQAVEESAEAQLHHLRDEYGRLVEHDSAETQRADAAERQLAPSPAAALLEVARRRRAEPRDADAAERHAATLDEQLESLVEKDRPAESAAAAAAAAEGDLGEEERGAAFEEDLSDLRAQVEDLQRELKQADRERDAALEEAEESHEEEVDAQRRAATALAGKSEAEQERDLARDHAERARQEAEALRDELQREEEQEEKAAAKLKGTEGNAEGAEARVARLRGQLARAVERAKGLEDNLATTERELEEERRRRVQLDGKLVTAQRELSDAHRESLESSERADKLARERDAAERRLRTTMEAQERAEEQVRTAESRAHERKADAASALAEAKEQRAAARSDAAGKDLDGATQRDPCVRASTAQAEAHELSLEIRVSNTSVHTDRVELERLQTQIERLDARADELGDKMEAGMRQLDRAVGRRGKEVDAFHEAAREHDEAADAARRMRGHLMQSRLGLTNGELRAYVGKEMDAAKREQEEFNAVRAVVDKVRAGELPAHFLDEHGRLRPQILREVLATAGAEPKIIDGRRVVGYTHVGKPILEGDIEASALDENDPMHAVMKHLRELRSKKRGDESALLEVARKSDAKSPAQRSEARRLREYLSAIARAASASHEGLEAAETKNHEEYVETAQQLQRKLDRDRLELRRVRRERTRLQSRREAFQDNLIREVAKLQGLHRRYKDATHLVMVGLEKCNGSSSSLDEGEMTLSDRN